MAGAYATAVNGDITMVFNDGVFSHRIFGGLYTGNKTISGSTSLYINGGTFMNEIYAGNKTNGTISQGTSLTVTARTPFWARLTGTTGHGRSCAAATRPAAPSTEAPPSP